jgi:uncharacterized protein
LRAKLVEPKLDLILSFCAEDPVERVFLEDVARRGLGRFRAIVRRSRLEALCHVGANVVPSGERCERLADAVWESGAKRMVIGEERAVSELWGALRERMPAPREDRPGQPVFLIEEAPEAGWTGLRSATLDDLDRLLPACAAAHEEELGDDPMARDSDAFVWRTRSLIEDGRSWVWMENDTILFKAEASAWTPSAVQIQQVWVDPEVRRQGNAQRAMRERIGMKQTHTYRSLLF